MRILGLDPGIATIGYGVIEGDPPAGLVLVTCGCIRTDPSGTAGERLAEAYRDVVQIIAVHRPGLAAVESLFFNRNVSTAIGVGQTRGVLLLALVQAGVPVAEYTPLAVKSAVVGYGRATKSQVQAMVARILRLASPPRPDDAADALAVALCHRFTTRWRGARGAGGGAAVPSGSGPEGPAGGLRPAHARKK
jgi:crossover junction endodeoxyribonuclease RuvC